MSVEGEERLRKQRLKDMAVKRAMAAKEQKAEPAATYVI
jgi:hypothetical protein